MGPSGVLRPHRLNLTKSDCEMPDKLMDTIPNGYDLHHLILVGMELCLVTLNMLKRRICRSTTRG